jgi:hypothetical protein
MPTVVTTATGIGLTRTHTVIMGIDIDLTGITDIDTALPMDIVAIMGTADI